VILILSDLHLGKDPSSDPQRLDDLASCVEVLAPSHIVFNGDVFDAFIDGSGKTPAFVNAWIDLVSPWLDRGMRVTYLQGNHDRWHRGTIAEVIGESVVRRSMQLRIAGASIHVEHGDHAEPHGGLTESARRFSSHRGIYRLYTLLFPFGAAQRFAAWVSSRGASFEPCLETNQALQDYAKSLLASREFDGVIMGHGHDARMVSSENGGVYVNSGDWYLNRSFCALSDDKGGRVALMKWQDGEAITVNETRLEQGSSN